MERTEGPAALTEGQVAKRLAVSTAALRAWRRQGLGPRYRRFVGCIRYMSDDVADFIRASASRSRSVSADDRESTRS